MPGGYAAFKLLMAVRLLFAFLYSIGDLDETFNYWERTHLQIFGKVHQSWEYDTAFTLHSYLYLLVTGLPGYLYNILFDPNRTYTFYVIRWLVALASSWAEVYFYQLVRTVKGEDAGRVTLWALVLSAGMHDAGSVYIIDGISTFFNPNVSTNVE